MRNRPKILPANESVKCWAFTSVELLAVVVILFILATVTVPALFKSRERVLRAECAGNLRQIGVGLNMYCTEANGYVPICGWPSAQSPWQTYSAARVIPGTSTLTRGYMSLGLLFRTGVSLDPREFYCPGLALLEGLRKYDYYATAPNTWPSTPFGSGDDQIRTGYNYYPQVLATQPVGGKILPKLTFTPMQLEFLDGASISLVTPARLADLNTGKSIATDLVQSPADLSHRADDSVAGLNALFPDGRVVFQTPGNNPQGFDPALWNGIQNVGDDPAPYPRFRGVMNAWKP